MTELAEYILKGVHNVNSELSTAKAHLIKSGRAMESHIYFECRDIDTDKVLHVWRWMDAQWVKLPQPLFEQYVERKGAWYDYENENE